MSSSFRPGDRKYFKQICRLFHVEQRIRAKTYLFSVRTLLLVGLIALIMGCKQQNPTPELSDPIYRDLETTAKGMEAAIVPQEKKIEAAKAELKKMAERDPFRKRQVSEVFRLERELVDIRQAALYFQVRVEQRRKFAREDYLKAFRADKPWPDPNEFDRYKKTKELQHASRNWGDRVPRLRTGSPTITNPDGKSSAPEKAAAH